MKNSLNHLVTVQIKRARLMSLVALAVVTCLLSSFLTLTSASASGGGKVTLQLWLGGDFTGSTTGTPYLKWVNNQIASFKKATGDNVQVTLLPVDNSQLAAKIDAAFASGQVPDLMVLYTGAYTTNYESELLPLNSMIKSTPNFYKDLGNWDLSCANYNCKNGRAKVFGIPISGGTYVLFYNKELFAKVGIKSPPTTYKQMYVDCAIFNKHGIEPISYGDLNGYDTSNVLTSNLVSTLPVGGIQSLLSGKLSYASPAVVNALKAVDNLAAGKENCMSPSAFTTTQYNGTNDFVAGKAAMATFYSALLSQFETALGKNLGVARQPVSGHGPLLKVNNGYAGDSFDNFVIPKASPHASLAWKFIKLASSAGAQSSMSSMIGLTPVNQQAIAKLNPIGKFIANLSVNPAIVELDQAMPTPDALYFYSQLHLAFDGSETALQAMKKMQSYSTSQRKNSGG
jgi:ABC-type glycerol-3-phosphate transport system substrate-binding protein